MNPVLLKSLLVLTGRVADIIATLVAAQVIFQRFWKTHFHWLQKVQNSHGTSWVGPQPMPKVLDKNRLSIIICSMELILAFPIALAVTCHLSLHLPPSIVSVCVQRIPRDASDGIRYTQHGNIYAKLFTEIGGRRAAKLGDQSVTAVTPVMTGVTSVTSVSLVGDMSPLPNLPLPCSQHDYMVRYSVDHFVVLKNKGCQDQLSN